VLGIKVMIYLDLKPVGVRLLSEIKINLQPVVLYASGLHEMKLIKRLDKLPCKLACRWASVSSFGTAWPVWSRLIINLLVGCFFPFRVFQGISMCLYVVDWYFISLFIMVNAHDNLNNWYQSDWVFDCKRNVRWIYLKVLGLRLMKHVYVENSYRVGGYIGWWPM